MTSLALFSPSGILFVSFFVFLYYYLRFLLVSSKYWSKRNIPHLKPLFILGNTWRANIFENIIEINERMYLENRKKKVVGFWTFTKPALFVMDLELVKRILVKDFSNFRDREVEKVNTDLEPLRGHLFLMKGKSWRNLRVKLTPTFTSGKMKLMFPTMVRCGKNLEEYLKKPAEAKKSIGVKDLMARYTTDVISSCAFGIETNSLENPNSEFRQYGKKIIDPNYRVGLVTVMRNTWPSLLDIFKVRIIPKDVSDYFINAVRETIDYRVNNNKTRNDFLQLLIQLMRAGKLEDAEKTPGDESDDVQGVGKFSLEEAAAQCFVFFLAGFETSSTALTFTLYELARNPDIQTKLHEEIDRVLGSDSGDITYEAMGSMEYLDKVVQESLRKYPPADLLQRISATDYYVPELDATIDKGTRLIISITGIHHDPDIYPDPDKFDPERFSPEEKSKRHPLAYFPFGDGPRSCIGNRFGLMQIKIGLIFLLRKYNVEMCKATPVPITLDVRGFFPSPVGGMPLVFTKRS